VPRVLDQSAIGSAASLHLEAARDLSLVQRDSLHRGNFQRQCRPSSLCAPWVRRFSTGSSWSRPSSARSGCPARRTPSPCAQPAKCRSDSVELITSGARRAGVVLPVSVTWSENRYELGFFRVTTQQMLHERAARYERVMAEPYTGESRSHAAGGYSTAVRFRDSSDSDSPERPSRTS
jgi:hypothetical protein